MASTLELKVLVRSICTAPPAQPTVPEAGSGSAALVPLDLLLFHKFTSLSLSLSQQLLFHFSTLFLFQPV